MESSPKVAADEPISWCYLGQIETVILQTEKNENHFKLAQIVSLLGRACRCTARMTREYNKLGQTQQRIEEYLTDAFCTKCEDEDGALCSGDPEFCLPQLNYELLSEIGIDCKDPSQMMEVVQFQNGRITACFVQAFLQHQTKMNGDNLDLKRELSSFVFRTIERVFAACIQCNDSSNEAAVVKLNTKMTSYKTYIKSFDGQSFPKDGDGQFPQVEEAKKPRQEQSWCCCM
jgi:hypothetical protein